MKAFAELLLAVSGLLELAVLVGVSAYPEASAQATVLVAVLVVVPALLVGYFADRLGFVYGVVLGIMPAMLGLTVLPTPFLGLSRVGGASVLFVAYVLASGLSGAAGQFAAKWRHAA